MGPHFFKCGKEGDNLLRTSGGDRFNGAALFQVRKGIRRLSPARRIRRFNGAALFQVRKVRRDRWTSFRQSIASMGPHFFKCGKSKYTPAPTSSARELQWGRTFSSAERWKKGNLCGVLCFCFNGAALFQVRKGMNPAAHVLHVFVLQWGRTFSSAERPPPLNQEATRRSASMGPHFFKCGKRRAVRV